MPPVRVTRSCIVVGRIYYSVGAWTTSDDPAAHARCRRPLSSIVGQPRGQHVPEVVVIGNGGHSRSCVDASDPASDFELIGCIGESADSRSELPYLGTDDALPGLLSRGVRHVFVAVGAGPIR